VLFVTSSVAAAAAVAMATVQTPTAVVKCQVTTVFLTVTVPNVNWKLTMFLLSVLVVGGAGSKNTGGGLQSIKQTISQSYSAKAQSF